MAYNEYQKMHYTAMVGNKQPKTTPSKKKYALFAGGKVMKDTEGLPYPVLVHKKNELTAQGHRFLTIKPIK